MAHMDIAERRLPQDGRMNLHANNQEIDVRVSTIPTVNGESISLRLLSRGEQQFGFDRLDMSKKQEKTIRYQLAQPNGIILLTGPTGCGKSNIVVLLFEHDQFGAQAHHHDRRTGRIQIAGAFCRWTGNRRSISHSRLVCDTFCDKTERGHGWRNPRRRNG